MGVKLPIRVLLGRTQLAPRHRTSLETALWLSLIVLPDDPVEIIVNDRVIAQGEVVVVGGNYGVRITKIASRGSSRNPKARRPISSAFRKS